MLNIVKSYVNVLSKDDILKFANKNNLSVTKEEVDFVYIFIKSNYEYILKNPDNFNIDDYKDKFSKENYEFIKKLVNKYKRMII